MPRASATCLNAALNGIIGAGSTNTYTHNGLNVGDPGTTGANENANSGGYARQAISFNAPSAGSMTNSGALTYSTAGSVPVTHFSGSNSGTYGGGTYSIGGALAVAVTAGTITIAAGGLTVSAS